jgi:hypothetical protein
MRTTSRRSATLATSASASGKVAIAQSHNSRVVLRLPRSLRTTMTVQPRAIAHGGAFGVSCRMTSLRGGRILPKSMSSPGLRPGAPGSRRHGPASETLHRSGHTECSAWCISGKRGQIYTWGDGSTWLLSVRCRSPRHWTATKRRLAFCELTQDCDEEGCLRLRRLPTPAEAVVTRDVLGIRKRAELSPTSANDAEPYVKG